MACPIIYGHDGWDIIIVQAIVFLRIVLVLIIVLLLVLLVVNLVKPREPDQINRRELNASIVEEFNDLGMNVSPSITTHRDGHVPDHEYCPKDHPGRACDPQELGKAS
jgi:hypothetical protein